MSTVEITHGRDYDMPAEFPHRTITKTAHAGQIFFISLGLDGVANDAQFGIVMLEDGTVYSGSAVLDHYFEFIGLIRSPTQPSRTVHIYKVADDAKSRTYEFGATDSVTCPYDEACPEEKYAII